MKALSVHKLEKLDVVGRNIMTGNMIGFVIWAMVGVIIISLGIRAYLSGKVSGFWANIKSISVNDIENIIKKHFNTNASNVKRLVNTEVSRVINEINNVQFKELGVKKVIYNAELDKGTCEVCEGLHGTIFKLEDKPVIPQHPNCRCYYEIKE